MGELDKARVVAFIMARVTWFYKGDAVWNEFQEFLQKLENGDFDIKEDEEK